MEPSLQQTKFDGVSSFKFDWKIPPNVDRHYVSSFDAKLLPNGRLTPASHGYQWQSDKGKDEVLEMLANQEKNSTQAIDSTKIIPREEDNMKKDEVEQTSQSERIDFAMNQCQMIGYSIGTEKFADCVIQLIK